MEKNTEIIRKKILFRSWHRGTKEMDLILGTYADNNLSNMSYDELMHFQSFLNLSDPDLYKWLISEEKNFPEEFKDLIYVRSIATRKSSGSAPLIVSDMVDFLIAVGWERVIIETVGSGQSEVRCAAISDRIVVVEGPARGDGVQAEKACLLYTSDAADE